MMIDKALGGFGRLWVGGFDDRLCARISHPFICYLNPSPIGSVLGPERTHVTRIRKDIYRPHTDVKQMNALRATGQQGKAYSTHRERLDTGGGIPNNETEFLPQLVIAMLRRTDRRFGTDSLTHKLYYINVAHGQEAHC